MKPARLADLHMHTLHSDGELHPEALVQLAADNGLSMMALTDHDTLMGVDEAVGMGRHLGVEVIAGIELSVCFEKKDLHLLGYFVQRGELLRDELRRLQVSRVERARKICERLTSLGLPMQYSAVEARAKGSVVARPHIAEEMIANGYVDNFQEAFNRYLGDSSQACVSKQTLDLQEGVYLLRQAGAVPVIAHPHVSGCADHMSMLRRLGVLGVEVWHPSQDDSVVDFYLERAHALDMVPTGGSDFHRRIPGGILPGALGTPPESMQRLRRLVA